MIPLLVQPISNEESTNILPVPWIRFHRCRFHGIDRLASKVWQGSIDGCHIIPALVAFWKIGSLAALIFLIVDGYHWLKNRTPSAKRRPLFQDREISLTETLLRMTEQSALGRWQCAQSPESTREIRLRLAASFVRTTALNGQIAVRGRQRKSVNYEMIDRDFWHSAYIAVEHDSASICKPVILAMGDVTIPDYDGLIIERESVEALWPRYEWKYIWRTLLLSAKAKLKGTSLQMPELDKKEETTPTPAEPEAIAARTVETIPAIVLVPAPVVITPSPDAPEGWEKLFAVGDDGRSVWLRFLPDKKSPKADALLLIVYGHKVLLGESRVNMRSAHAAVRKTVDNAPNNYSTSSAWSGLIATMVALQQENNDYANEYVGSYLERVGLAQGGMYQLTDFGMQEAIPLARDLIR